MRGLASRVRSSWLGDRGRCRPGVGDGASLGPAATEAVERDRHESEWAVDLNAHVDGRARASTLARASGTAARAGGLQRAEVQEVAVDGDGEMARVDVTDMVTTSFGGVGGTGRSLRIHQAAIAHLRDGKVVAAREIADIAALRVQVAPG